MTQAGRAGHRQAQWGSLRLQLTLGIALALVTVGAMLSMLAARELETDYTQVVFAGQASNARSLATQLQREAEFRLRSLDALAHGLPAEAWQDARRVQAYLDDKPLARTLFSRDVYVVSTAGRRIAEVPARGNLGADYAQSEYVKRALRGEPVVLPLVGRFSKRPNLIFAMPVRDAAGRVVAIVCGSEELEPGSAFYLSDFLRNGADGGYLVLALNERLTLAASDASRVLEALQPPGENALLDRRIEQGDLGPAQALNRRGKLVLSTAEKIASLNWLVISYASADEVFAPLHAMVRMVRLGTGAATLIALALAWWGLGRLLRPLSDAAQAIREIDPAGAIPHLQEVGSTEIRALLHHFNALHEVVSAQHMALRDERDRLEATVAARTQALADTERFIRTVTDALPSGVGYWDAELRNRYANLAYQGWFGRAPAQLLGMHIRDLLGAELFALNEAHVHAALAGEPQRFERRLMRADGQTAHTWTHYIPDVAEGRVRGFFVLINDITEVKQAEEALRKQAEELDDVYNRAPSGYHSLAADGRFLRINDTELGWLGYERDELIGKRRIQDVLTPASIAIFAANFPRVQAGASLNELEMEFVRKDGSTYPALVSVTAICDAEGRFIKSRSVIVDYTRLRRQQQTLRGVLTSAPMAVRIADMADGRIRFMNEAFLQLVQRRREEVLDTDMRELYCDAAEIADIHRRLDAGETVLNRLVELHVPDQPERPHVWALGSYTVVDYEGRRCMLAWLYDVSDLQRARASAEAATRAKSDFLANMSHEIRTPLHAVLGLAQLLHKEDLSPGASSLVRKIRGAGRTLQAIINDILDFSRIEADRLVIEQAIFRLGDVLDNLATIMASNVGSKPVELIVDPPPEGIDWVVGDALRLEQVLINLTSNAIKFTENGHVRVGITCQAANAESCTLRFTVEDTGIGLSDDAQRRIFAPFEQADSSTTRRFGGTGLGLAISRRLATLMGGDLGVSSRLGQGSLFSLTLPLGRTQGERGTSNWLAELSVLIADDNTISLESLRRTAAMLGWTVSTCNSGLAAVDHARLRRQQGRAEDVLILDWDMPGLDGIHTAQAIGSESGTQPPPVVIMVTAHGREAFLAAPGAEIADAVLSKPVTPSSMHDAVLHALRARHPEWGETPGAEDAARPRLQGLRLLVVDDSEVNREVAEAIFAGEGATVTPAADGAAALAWLDVHAGEVDAVLMDLQMPGLDGIEVLRRMRERPALARLPVLALSAGVMKEQRDAARAAGMVDFISKPFDIDVAIVQILRATGRMGMPTATQPPHAATGGSPPLALEMARQVFREEPELKRWLRRFADEHAGFVAASRSADAASVASAAHKMCGAAGNLGLLPLSEAAAGLEQAARSGAGHGPELAAVQAALEAALSAIAQYAGTDDGPGATGAGTAPGLPADLATRLLAALAEDRPDGVEPLLAELQGRLPAQVLAPLRQAVEAFDFRAAEALVRALAAG